MVQKINATLCLFSLTRNVVLVFVYLIETVGSFALDESLSSENGAQQRREMTPLRRSHEKPYATNGLAKILPSGIARREFSTGI